MSNPRIITLSQQIVDTISAAKLSQTVSAELNLVPDLELQNIKGVMVQVCPRTRYRDAETRGSDRHDFEIDIAVLSRAKASDIPGLIMLVEEIESLFFRKKIDIDYIFNCVGTENAPLYVPEHIRRRKQFTSILTLNYRGAVTI